MTESVYSGRTGRRLVRRVFTPAPTPDLDGDGFVDAEDLSILVSRIGRSSGRNAAPLDGDLNGDSVIGSADIAVLLNSFGGPVVPGGAAAMLGGGFGGGCLEECPDGRLARCGSCGFDPGGGVDGTGTVGDEDDCFDPDRMDDPDCAGAGGGGGGNNTGGNNTGDNDPPDEPCQAGSMQTTISVAVPELQNLLNRVEQTATTAVPWLGALNLDFNGGFSLTTKETCCPDDPTPPSAPVSERIYRGAANAQIGVTLETFPLASGMVLLQVPNPLNAGEIVGVISAEYQVGPQLQVGASANVSANGSIIDGPCPSCAWVDASGSLNLVGSVGGSASAIVTFVNPLSLWGGGRCPVGFQFQAGASASVSTGACLDGRWNLNECFSNGAAGFAGGTFIWDGISGKLKVTASTHFVDIDVTTSTLTLIKGNSWPL